MASRKMATARNMPDAANADNSLEGYAAVNSPGANGEDEIRQIAYRLYEERGDGDGSPEDDWFRAEQEVRRRRGGAAL